MDEEILAVLQDILSVLQQMSSEALPDTREIERKLDTVIKELRAVQDELRGLRTD